MPSPSSGAALHWDTVYKTKKADQVSWYERSADISLRLLALMNYEPGGAPPGAVLDVGAGASPLVDALLEAGYIDVSLLDVSATALDLTRRRLTEHGNDLGRVGFVVSDVIDWRPDREYAIWHDRAVFHFVTDPGDRRQYVANAAAAVRAGGALIIGTFADDGPTHCSGLEVARYTPDRLGGEFSEYFAPVHSERELHSTPSGATQSFTWVCLRRRG